MTEMAATARRRLHERALEQYGYITTRDAAELGVSLNALHVLVNRGGLTRAAHGVYRFDDVPASGRDSYMEAVLAVGEGAFLYADAVLAIRDLALVNPARLRVGTAKRRDKTLPPTIEMVVVDVPPADREVYEGIPCTTVARALVDSIGIVMPERLLDAARDAAERGLMRRKEAASVIARLGGETAWPTNPAT
jgi:predicted transcriptional regulator of viral defense system